MPRHRERHGLQAAGWLRAAVLGANDGIISTAGLIVGVAASGATPSQLLGTGVAGLVAGAMSMAAGEYVSVQSQADMESAVLAQEKRELAQDPQAELEELSGIYQQRGLEPALALQVARQLTAHDALASHAREELGLSDNLKARPLQAAAASAAAFSVGAVLPIAAAGLAPAGQAGSVTVVLSLVALLLSGGLAAWAGKAGKAGVVRGALRVGFWGAAAMAAAQLIGQLFQVPLA